MQYLGLTQALRLAQPKFMEQFRRMLLSKLRVVFENASSEIELWNKAASAQVDSSCASAAAASRGAANRSSASRPPPANSSSASPSSRRRTPAQAACSAHAAGRGLREQARRSCATPRAAAGAGDAAHDTD